MKKYFAEKLPQIEKELDNLLKINVDSKWYEKNIGKLVLESGSDDTKINFEFDAKSWETAINAPMIDMLERGGKRLRPLICILIHEMLGGKDDNIYKMATLPELIHNATLMVDDIEDNSMTRRGKECTYRKFGVNVAVNNGNFYYFYPMYLVGKLIASESQKMAILELITEKMMTLHIGQAMDIDWANNNAYDDVGKDKYLLMSAYKTGALLSIAMQIGAIMAGAQKPMLNIIDQMAIKIGIAYQIKDDILNLKADEEWGKQVGEDITEGKITLLVVETIKQADDIDKKRIIEILHSKPTDQKLIFEVIAIMDKYLIFEKLNKFSMNLILECKNDLREYFPANHLAKVMDELLDYVISRSK
jgi:geranylgeranyl pyrophosphate synthase